MKKQNAHIIYIVEDGVTLLTCGVGVMAQNFINGFSEMARDFKKKKINLKFSIITIMPKNNSVGMRSNLLKSTKKICNKFSGDVYFIKSKLKPTDNYFNSKIWKKYNEQVMEKINNLIKSKNDKTIIISNDTIFGHIKINLKDVFCVWIPNSLSKNHKQSYIDNKKRFAWEKKAVNIIKQNKNCFLGYVSDNVRKQLIEIFGIEQKKMLPFKNGFYLPLLEKYKYSNEMAKRMLEKRGIPTDKNIIFSFNRADEYKNLDLTLKSMLKIAAKYNLHAVLIASKFSEEPVVKKIQAKLKQIAKQQKDGVNLFLGYEFELPKYVLRYKNTKILLNLPKNDFCPLVPFESELISHKDLCIINSNIPCFSSIIKNDHDGFLCQPKVNEVTSTVDKVLNMPERKKLKIIKRGKRRAKKQMDLIRSYKKSIEYLINK